MGKTGVLQAMGSQRVGHNLVTEQQQMTILTDAFMDLSGPDIFFLTSIVE